VSSWTEAALVARVLLQAGVLRPMRPDRLARVAAASWRFGASPAAGYAAGAARHPRRIALVDEAGSLTYREVDERSSAVARGLRAAGVGEGDGVAILCRNHRGFVESVTAVAKLGARAVLMNTMFSGPQLADVAKREDVRLLVYDGEFRDLLAGLPAMPRFVAWRDGEDADPALEDLVAQRDRAPLPAPRTSPRFVILTSGTTGTPKGAQRGQPRSLAPAAALLSVIPLRAGERTVVAAPLFHSWGFAHFTLGLLLGSTLVLQRRFDPERALQAVSDHAASAFAVVPVMLQRILALPEATRRRFDVRSLRVTAVSGSALPGELAVRWMDAFGDNLYNLYGSTEVAWASIATPADLRAAPGTAGRPPFGTQVRILDERGRELPPGRTGRIFVGNAMPFEGYTGGGDKERIGGLLSSGDVGHFDAEGRLFVDGRDDEMIVSGGENVFPREVEDCLSTHDAVEEAAVVGVPDPEWGQRLRAFVVLRAGASVTEPELKALVRSRLAAYKVPRDVLFLDRLPRNATGKILKRELQ
jgi:fatty-acyl-CoA synthase